MGPVLFLGFYGFICFNYLVRPAQNDIVPNTLDARWVYYAWFLMVVFILDWARTGLANVDAVALMRPRLAPRTAYGHDLVKSSLVAQGISQFYLFDRLSSFVGISATTLSGIYLVP